MASAIAPGSIPGDSTNTMSSAHTSSGTPRTSAHAARTTQNTTCEPTPALGDSSPVITLRAPRMNVASAAVPDSSIASTLMASVP